MLEPFRGSRFSGRLRAAFLYFCKQNETIDFDMHSIKRRQTAIAPKARPLPVIKSNVSSCPAHLVFIPLGDQKARGWREFFKDLLSRIQLRSRIKKIEEENLNPFPRTDAGSLIPGFFTRRQINLTPCKVYFTTLL
jgi:hypothetical protein